MAKGKRPKKTTKPDHDESQTSYQRFTVEEIDRGLIKNAPYNPRTITPEARERLKERIQAVGLVNTLVWNRRTGNLVGGHQRLSILDELEGSLDYTLKVSVVNLCDRDEKALNVFLNNTAAMGEWDETALADIIASLGGDQAGMGFAPGELDYLNPKGEAEEDGPDGQQLAEAQKDCQVVVVFRNKAEVMAFMDMIRSGGDSRHIDGRKHFSKYGFNHQPRGEV